MRRISRRQFLRLGTYGAATILGADARFIEPTSLKVTNFRLPEGRGDCRFVHFTDFHFKGDTEYAAEVVAKINELATDFVCFTGDLVENKMFADQALHFIQQIKVPVYASPGNHDYWSGISFTDCERAFAATGGAWLVDQSVVLPKYGLELIGMAVRGIHAFKSPEASRRVLLSHYPDMARQLHEHRFDLILSGHSHGGQIRLPFIGALIVPYGVGAYDLGYYETPGGPLYVNAGIGTVFIPMRWNCRPELTVITI